MALQYPLAIDDFAGLFTVSDRSLDLSEARELNETGGGDLLIADVGPRLWRGYYQLKKLEYRDHERIRALVEALQMSARAFHAYDHVMPGLRSDPDGVAVNGFTPTISKLDGGNAKLKINGLPVGLEFSRGDRFSFVTSTGAVALHRVVSNSKVAGVTGETPWIEVVPHILPGAAIGDPVALYRPYIKARIVPGSFKPGRPKGLHVEGMRFDFVQQVK